MQLTPIETFPLPPGIDDSTPFAFGVGARRELCFAIESRTASPHRRDYRLLQIQSGFVTSEAVVATDDFPIHHLQPFGDGWLAVNARSRRIAGTYAANARVYDSAGTLQREFRFGDGIESVQIAPSGDTWVSYFDEGTLGDPIGASGLVAFDADGAVRYRYTPDATTGFVLDCYALNVAGDDDVWLYYYTDFPLVHLQRHRIAAVWRPQLAGARALAVKRDRALLAGCNRDRNALHRVQLLDGERTRVAAVALVDDAGSPIALEHVEGRGEFLYVLSAGLLHIVEVP